MKKILLFLIIFIVSPICVFAMTEEEAYKELDKFPGLEMVDSKRYLELRMVDIDTQIGEQCLYTEEDFNNWAGSDDTGYTIEEWIEEQTGVCRMMYYNDTMRVYLDYLNRNIDMGKYAVRFDSDDQSKCIISYSYGDDLFVSYEAFIKYLDNIGEKEVKKANKILSNLYKEDRLYGLQLVNIIYHYGIIDLDELGGDKIYARYPKFKKVMESHPEYDYVATAGRGGGPPITRHRAIQIGMFKDDILYGVKLLDHYEEEILFVDEKEEGTVQERLEARLNKYFKNKVSVTVQVTGPVTDTGFFEEEFDSYMNNFLETKDLHYDGYVALVNINGMEKSFVVAEVHNKYLDRVSVESRDRDTDVNIKTDSYDVPLDAIVKVKDVKNEKNVKDFFEKLDMDVKYAYDISLMKLFDNSLIKAVDGGIEVYIPVSDNYKVGDKEKVYYVSDDKEVYDGEVVSIENKKYVRFVTKHFSTYAIGNKIINNPQTYDNISISMIIFIMSLIIIIGFCILNKSLWRKRT